MKRNKIIVLIFAMFVICSSALFGQKSIPIFKPYPGSVHGFSAYFSFNLLEIKAVEGGQFKKAAGEYWDQNFLLDTVGSYDITVQEYFRNSLKELNAQLYFEDERNIYFSFIENNKYYWGRFLSKDHKSYRIHMVLEKPILKRLEFNSSEPIIYDDYLAKMPVPPIIRPISGSIAVTGKFSKFNILNMKYSSMGKRYEKSAGGAFWNYKFEFKKKGGKRDTSISIFEIKENFIQEVNANNGTIVHNLGYLLIFTIPGDDYDMWCRLSILQHGLYILNIVKEMKEDISPPVEIR